MHASLSSIVPDQLRNQNVFPVELDIIDDGKNEFSVAGVIFTDS
jgi:hypothetical protein